MTLHSVRQCDNRLSSQHCVTAGGELAASEEDLSWRGVRGDFGRLFDELLDSVILTGCHPGGVERFLSVDEWRVRLW